MESEEQKQMMIKKCNLLIPQMDDGELVLLETMLKLVVKRLNLEKVKI